MKWMVGLCFLAAGLGNIALAEEWSKSFPVSGHPELRVDAGDGAVVVRTWDRHEIEARVITDRWKIPADVEVIDRQTGDRVELEVRMRHHFFLLYVGQRSIQVELHVPRDLRSDIHTGDGSIRVDSLHGETRLETGDGRIDATALDGSLQARTGDGSVHVQGRFDLLDLHTGDGSIEAEIAPGSKMTSEWNVRTGDGHVTLRVPASFSAYLDVHTGDGHIQSDLPVKVSGGPMGRHELRGNLNAGGPSLIVHTNDGSVRLERL